MCEYPSSPKNGPGTKAGSVGQRIDEAVELIELELRHAIGYVNDAVIPQVRRESITAMRTVANTLRDLADRIDQHDSSNRDTNHDTNKDQRP